MNRKERNDTRAIRCRCRSRAAATSKMERFVIIVKSFQPLTIITKRSILDVAAALDPPLSWMRIDRPEARIYQDEIKTRRKFHKIRGCLQDT